jgi:hypothetical protein
MPLSTGMYIKFRPAVVVAPVPYGQSWDYLLCIVTSQSDAGDRHKIEIMQGDVLDSTRPIVGYIRPTVLFTMDNLQVNRTIGRLTSDKLDQVIDTVRGPIDGRLE